MKKLVYLFLVIFVCSCTNNKESDNSVISIDLSNLSADVNYSQFVKSVDYIVLNPGDTCKISGIKKLYIDSDTIIIQDTKRDGICIFTSEGDFVKQINYIGNGPHDYLASDAITVDTIHNRILIYDIMGFKINSYNYQGVFLDSKKVEHFFRDFEINSDGSFIMVQPNANKVNPKNGAWKYSPQFRFEKQYLEHTPNELNFEFVSTYMNRTPNTVYYYDRNDDNIYSIDRESACLLYHVDLKQYMPNDVRALKAPMMNDLNGYAMMYDFCFSSKYIAFTYFLFGDKSGYPYKWVFHNRENGETVVCNQFVNDFDTMESSDNRLFYVNDSTWCRVVDSDQNDCNTILQIMHL